MIVYSKVLIGVESGPAEIYEIHASDDCCQILRVSKSAEGQTTSWEISYEKLTELSQFVSPFEDTCQEMLSIIDTFNHRQQLMQNVDNTTIVSKPIKI